MRVLLSGFEPFGGEHVNPTAALISAVAQKPKEFFLGELRTLVLPVSFARCFDLLKNEIHDFDPDVVLCLGLAAGRSEFIELERVAINKIDCLIADNDGRKPVDEPALMGGENAFFSTLPLKEMLAELDKARVPARLSNSAGTYVCNYLMYRLLEASLRTRRRAGFVHVPFLPEQASAKNPPAPSMALDKLQLGLRALLSVL